MVYELTQEKIEKYTQCFNYFDRDRDGYLNPEELEIAIRSIGQCPTKTQINHILKELGNNKINFESYLSIIEQTSSTKEMEGEILNAFKVFDKEGRGVVLASELKHAMMTLGEKLTEEEVEKMINEAGVDEEGYIHYENFIKMMVKLINI